MTSKLNAIAIVLLLSAAHVSDACTSFVEAGSRVINHLPILAKVRDGSYSIAQSSLHKEDFRFFRHNDARYAYVAVMFAQASSQGSRDFISAGTNEKGLSVALNFATTESALIKKLYGSIAQQESDLIKDILKNSASIQEARVRIVAIDQKNGLVPCLLTISDSTGGLIVEIAVDGNKKIHYVFKDTLQTGYTYITNHFDAFGPDSLESYNQKISEDSAYRYRRINEMLTQETSNPYTFATALHIAKDYNDGELNSIFRHASRMTYIAQGNEQQSKVFVEFTNSAQLYNRAVITLDQKFWTNHTNGDVIIAADQPYNPGPTLEKFMTY